MSRGVSGTGIITSLICTSASPEDPSVRSQHQSPKKSKQPEYRVLPRHLAKRGFCILLWCCQWLVMIPTSSPSFSLNTAPAEVSATPVTRHQDWEPWPPLAERTRFSEGKRYGLTEHGDTEYLKSTQKLSVLPIYHWISPWVYVC